MITQLKEVTVDRPRRSTAPSFFGIIADHRTYLAILYLLLSFPLGIFYFVFLVTGLSLGLGLIITLVGVPILVGVIAGSYGLAAFERSMAMQMLRVTIPPMQPGEPPSGFWAQLRRLVASPATWKGIGYLFAKFPLGIFSFVVVVSLLAVSTSLVLAPFYYQVPGVVFGWLGGWQVDTMSKALLASLAGVGLLFGSLHAFRWMAWASGRFARLALGARTNAPPRADAPPAETVNPE
jgi:hypothetical protein